MGTRRKSRELVLQMLFQADMGKQTPDVVRKTFWGERTNVDAEVRGFADDLFRVAIDRAGEIDDYTKTCQFLVDRIGFMMTQGQCNKLVLANRAISAFEKHRSAQTIELSLVS